MRTTRREPGSMKSAITHSRKPVGLSAGIALCVVAAALTLAGTAAAETVELHLYNGAYPAGSFDGHDANGAGTFANGSIRELDVDQSTGNPSSGDVYVGNTNGHFYKFD